VLSYCAVSLTILQRNITRRLKLAKQECDTTLQKIIHNITQYIEEQIRTKQLDTSQTQSLRESLDLHTSDLVSAVANLQCPVDDTASDDAGYDADPEGRHSRQGKYSSLSSIVFINSMRSSLCSVKSGIISQTIKSSSLGANIITIVS